MTRGDATRFASRRTWSLVQGCVDLGFKRAVSLEHAMAHVIDHRLLVDHDDEGYGPGAIVRPGSQAVGTDAVNRSVLVLTARAYGKPFGTCIHLLLWSREIGGSRVVLSFFPVLFVFTGEQMKMN